MKLLKSLGKIAKGVVPTPVAIVADVVTVGGTATHEPGEDFDPYTVKQGRRIGKAVKDLLDDWQGVNGGYSASNRLVRVADRAATTRAERRPVG